MKSEKWKVKNIGMFLFYLFVVFYMVYFLFVIWFFLLIKWADLLVDWASALAKKFHISDLVIWLTIVAFGTSMPELVVNVISSITWSSGLVLGNVLWSNIANIVLILWVSATIYPLAITKRTVFLEIPFSILAIVLLWLMINDTFLFGNMSLLTRIDGSILLLFFALFMRYIFHISKKKQDLPVEVEIHHMSLIKMIIYIVVWLTGLAIWGNWIVNGAMAISQYLWISESVIWLSIVALGTSLPELATSVVAVMKKNSDIAIGNVVGSNIFNILWVLWISAVVSPIVVSLQTNRDVVVALLVSWILFTFIVVGKKFVIQKYQWRIMIAIYLLYMGIVFNLI